jgi:uncharacterized membrane protein YoaK (UPF0700 family)
LWWCTGRIPETAASDEGTAQGVDRRRETNRVFLSAGVWIAYRFGAILGAFLQERWTLWSLVLPIGVLILVAIWDLI